MAYRPCWLRRGPDGARGQRQRRESGQRHNRCLAHIQPSEGRVNCGVERGGGPPLSPKSLSEKDWVNYANLSSNFFTYLIFMEFAATISQFSKLPGFMNQSGPTNRFLDSTRGQVATLLRRGSRTVEELAVELGLTDNAVRNHLALLERDGVVRQVGVRRGKGAGFDRLCRVGKR